MRQISFDAQVECWSWGAVHQVEIVSVGGRSVGFCKDGSKHGDLVGMIDAGLGHPEGLVSVGTVGIVTAVLLLWSMHILTLESRVQ